MKKITTLGLLCLFSTQTFAYTCAGKVKGVSMSPTGTLMAESIGPLVWPKLCNVSSQQRGIAPETCQNIYSLLLTAQTTNKSVMFWFNDGKDCSVDSHTPWADLTGWYFGPKLMD